MRTRVAIAAVATLCAAIVGFAVTGHAPASPGPQFVQDGHWVYSDESQAAYHVDGATARVDAQVSVPSDEPGSQVTQGEQSGYVVQRSRITMFSKATLGVEGSSTPPATEQPVILEVAGGPYLVYRNAGQVVRLGDPAATVAAGGPLSRPAATGDGTVWLHRIDSGSLCSLMRSADRLVCHAQIEQGHAGGLTVVDDQAVLVDTTSDTLRTIGERGLGEPVAIGSDLPSSAYIASSAATDRLAVVDPDHARLILLDTAGLHNRPAAKPIVADLPRDGRFGEPMATANVIALIDQNTDEVLTFDRTGAPTGRAKVPAGTRLTTTATPTSGDDGAPRLLRGDDGRIYVDSPDGSHVLVVDAANGLIKSVRIGASTAAASASTVASPTSAPATAGTGGPSLVAVPAAAPAVTVRTTADAVIVKWNRPDLRRGSLVHYLVSAPGQPDRTVTGQTVQFPGQPGPVTVRAVTRFGPPGSRTLLGNVGSATISLKPPTIKILSLHSPNGGLLLNVQVGSEGSPTVCKMSFVGIWTTPQPCKGTTQLDMTNLAWIGSITVYANVTNAVGTQTVSITAVPTVP
ncbi:hypothetical protein HDA40_007231 [Hamadaea flava]|uniref:Fibronectin type-III domain-containing protein n=1 Tax=Hamadaea flava TaxID=1742688 RepID=A0ABV8LRA1_9ACTN|nr:hypothetical protein [Hamadaea flava]MCP2328724.1 hypothetical protein [Hamadaea flava]